jgi:hypothetical protein
MRHIVDVGERVMEVDHFDPRKKKDKIQEYDNLFLADRHCNSSKWDVWPNAADRRKGMRFLNCCQEMDYGEQIFEDRLTHKLIGFTPAARYHIRILQLNAPHLVTARRHRLRIREVLSACYAQLEHLESRAIVVDLIQRLKEVAEIQIPDIPPPP